MGNTTLLNRKLNDAWGLANTVYRKMGGAWGAANAVYLKQGGVWGMVYSTPTVSMSNTGSVTGSGASSSGTTSASVTATAGGANSGSLSYSYAYVSGDAGFSISSGNGTTSPTFSRSFSGVPNGATSSGVSATWRGTITDNVTGATSVGNFTVGPFAWRNTIPAYTKPVVTISGDPEATDLHEFGSASVDTTVTCTANVTGGTTVGPFAYAWSLVGTDNAEVSLTSASNVQSPTWRVAAFQDGVGDTSNYETWEVVVTDLGTGLSSDPVQVSVGAEAEVDND